MRIFFTGIFMLFFTIMGIAQENYTISGYVKDASTGETLIGANIYDEINSSSGTVSNVYGFYSLTLPAGEHTVVFSYLGFSDQKKQMNLTQNEKFDISLAEGVMIEEIVVTAEAQDKNVTSTEMGTVSLEIEQIKKIPAFMGEVDVLKTLQLLPGVASAGEGSSGFYVRGGGPDQNLVLLDEATVYNSGHMLGFFSVFNADALKNTTLIKGGMPARYGGRLSSVVDIQMKDGNYKDYGVQGGIGTVSSRLTVEGPIQKDKSSFLLSGRRTYLMDLLQPAIKNSNFAGTNYYFYDLNTKINFILSDKDRLFFSGYFGRDVLNYNSKQGEYEFKMPYGNTTATARWNHLFSEKLFMNTSLIYNKYDFSFEAGQADFSLKVFSGIEDYNLKLDLDFFPNPSHSVKFGANYTYHKFTPNIGSGKVGEEEFSNGAKPKYGHEAAIYVEDDYKINNRLTLNYGVRGSLFSQIGPYESGDKTYSSGEIVKTYTGLEPRLSGKYNIDKSKSIKAGLTFTNQYAHLVSNSANTLPIDVWVPSTNTVKPQKGIQYALGYFQNFKNNKFEASVEVYYKDLKNQIDYRENYVQDPAVDVEDEFVFGKGRAYGAEFFLKKSKGDFTGWVGYTLARTERVFADIRDGEAFPSTYDRTHDLSIVGNYEVSDKWNLSAVFIYGTAKAYTPITGLYFIENTINTHYGKRNSARLDPYHRMDFSATFTPKPKSVKRFNSSWVFSVYNVYNRKNPFFTYYNFESDLNAGTATVKGYKVTIFPVIPSITWNFKWKS